MFTDTRKNKLFHLLKEKPYSYNSELLGAQLSVSERTVRKEISEMNEIAQPHGFAVRNQRGEGFYLEVLDAGAFRLFQQSGSDHYFDTASKEGRVRAVIYNLLTRHGFCTLEELADQLYVGRTTLSNDLPDIRAWLERYEIRLLSKVGKGMQIEGSERQKRYAALSVIDEELNPQEMERFFGWKEKEDVMATLSDEIPQLFMHYHVYFTDDNLTNFLYHLFMMAERIELGFVLTEEQDESFGREQPLMHELTALLEKEFGITIPQAEQHYLYVQMKSKIIEKVGDDTVTGELLDAYIDALLGQINDNYYYDLTKEASLRRDLRSHIHSMLYRVRHKIRVRNPMEEHIKKYYPLAYEVTLYAVEAIKELYPYDINTGEIAYLALHIGASLERNYQIKYERHNSCLIVCGSGFGTARVIEATIKQTIPDLFITNTISAQQYRSLSYIEEDVVITTIEIEEKNKPVFKIDSLPSKKQVLALDKKLTSELNHATDLLRNYFSPAIFRKGRFETKEEVLQLLTSSLQSEGIVEDETVFLEAIMKRESLGPTGIGEGVAIPHPLNLLSRRTQIGVAIAEEPIDWGNGQQARLIFLLAISREDYEEAMGIYDFLVEIIRENHTDLLCSARNFHEFILKARMIYSS